MSTTLANLCCINVSFEHKTFLQNVGQTPGIYQMYDESGGLLYVGKAKNLKKRLSSYFRATGLPIKTSAMMQKVADVQVVVTHTENEALILEANLIKQKNHITIFYCAMVKAIRLFALMIRTTTHV